MIITPLNFDKAIQHIKQTNPLFVDLETTGLSPYNGDKICGVAIMAEEETYYFPFRHAIGENLDQKYFGLLGKELCRPDKIYIGHNYKFDLKFLRKEGVPLPEKILDTMIGAHLLNENEDNFKLKTLSDKYLGDWASSEEKTLKEKLEHYGYDKGDIYILHPKDVAPYAEQDVRRTKGLFEYQVLHLKREKTFDLFKEVSKFSLVITQMEIYGMKVDSELIEKYRWEAKENIDRVCKDIRAMHGGDINPGSPIQLQRWLGLKSTAKKVLENLKGKKIKEKADAVLEYRSWCKVNNLYYSKFLKLKDENDVLHPNLLVTGTISGRLSCSSPNLQQIPRYSNIYKVKDVFIARPGFSFLEIDYSQAEIRTGSHYAQESSMIKLLKSGVDIHSATSEEMQIDRFVAKTLNFSIIYGIGPKTLAKNLDITEAEALFYLRKYHRAYPGFKRLSIKAEKTAKNRRFIKLFTGRRRHYNCEKAETYKAISNLVQGAAAEMLRVSINRIWDELDRNKIRILLCVHDSIICEVTEGFEKEAAKQITDIMNDQPWCSVPIKSDVKVGKVWGQMREMEL